jgi:hypothetical protein
MSRTRILPNGHVKMPRLGTLSAGAAIQTLQNRMSREDGMRASVEADRRDAYQMRLCISAGAVSTVVWEINDGLFMPGAH